MGTRNEPRLYLLSGHRRYAVDKRLAFTVPGFEAVRAFLDAEVRRGGFEYVFNRQASDMLLRWTTNRATLAIAPADRRRPPSERRSREVGLGRTTDVEYAADAWMGTGLKR
jgi:hypothetical protein